MTQNDAVKAPGLTPREREVAVLVADGLTNRDIADRLVISERTAETHVEHIRSKLGVRSRAQVATWAVSGTFGVPPGASLDAASAAASSPHGSEHRVVTCLFADVAPLPDLTTRLGPERTKTLIDGALDLLGAIASAQGAVVERSTGAYFAMFGAPVAHSDDPMRALRAAEGAMRWGTEHPDTAIRVGVETGEVLVDLGAIAAGGHGIAFGGSIGLARRLRDEAAPGEVLVGPVCREATWGTAEFSADHVIDGAAGTMIAALVRTETAPAAPLPFVGRRRELDLLRAAFERARSHEAILALLIAPPGQGKTRTAEEFVAGIRAEAHVLRARCRPGAELGAQTPLHQILAGELGEVTPEIIERAVSGLIGDPGQGARTAAAIGHSAGVAADPRLMSLSASERLAAYSSAWRAYLGGLGVRRPVVIWVDDLHWADPQLVRLIDRITSGAGIPLLVVGAARPEFAAAALRPGPDRVLIDIGPLDVADAASLAVGAGAHDGRAAERAEGNPLFVIELARSRSTGQDEIPITLQAAIGARLDELSNDDRELLQLTSVAGEVFNVRDAILLVGRDHAEIAAALARLVQRRYLRSVDGGFRFHHPLVHEVTYRRLTTTDRMRLHARFAAGGVDPSDVLALAHHWWGALRPPDAEWVWEDASGVEGMRRHAIDAHIAAGQRSAEHDSHERAVELLERAIALSKVHTDVGRAEHALAGAYWRVSLGDEAWLHRLRAIDAYRRSGEIAPADLYADALELTMFQWGYFRTLPELSEVRRLFDEGLEAGRKAGNEVPLARLLVQRGFLLSDSSSIDAALEIVRAAKDPRIHTDALQRIALVQMQSGDIDGARATYRRVDELAAEGGTMNEVEMVWWRGITSYLAGDLAEVEHLGDRLTQLSAHRSAHLRSHALTLRSYLHFARAQWDQLVSIGQEIADLVTADPAIAFCLAPAGGAAYASVADSIRGRRSPLRLEELVHRMVPESAVVRDSTMLLPTAVGAGDGRNLSTAAFGAGPVWDRQVTDPLGLNLVMSLVVQERWRDLDRALVGLDRAAQRGSALARAVASTARAERAGEGDARDRAHRQLRSLGYVGHSEVMAFRRGDGDLAQSA